MKKLLLFLLIPFIVSFAQISISSGGSSVSENFNSMGTSASATLPANWKVDKQTTSQKVGTYSAAVNTTNYAAGINISASAGNGVYNFAVTSTDRAIGGLSSSSSSKSVNIYSYFQNSGASTISQVDLSYDVMRFRNGLNTAGFSIQLYYSTDGTTWTSAGSNFLSSFAGPNADNNGAAVVPMEQQQILNKTLSGFSIPQGGSLYLAFNYSATTGTTTSNAQAVGIDNFVMNNIGGASTAPAAPVSITATNITQTGFRANWNGSSGATGYFIDVSTSSSFTSFVSGYENKNVGNVLSFDVTNLTLNTTYYYRVRASNSFGASVNSNNISVTTLAQVTSVQFTGISDAVIKSAGTYTLDLSIIDPSATNATTCSITFVADSSTATASYLNNFSTQTVTFPAGSSANQHVVFTIKDNGVVEPAKKAFLQIQNVSGGATAQAGTISKFRLSITSGVDNSYYSTISSGLTGAELKAALHNLIKNCVKYPYTDSGIDVWKMDRAADEDPKNPNNVIGIYSGLSIGKDPQTYWNREHVWSKSHGNFGTDIGAGTDGHHLRPENNNVNTLKSNLDFDNGGALVPNGGGSKYDSDSWEPRDAVKGDIARMIFYMATRYNGDVAGEPNLTVIETIPSSPNNEPYYAKLSTLLAWNQQDPPDAFEMNRNNTIAYYQHNRNPYIDHPEWVSTIFGNTTSFTLTLSSSPAAAGTVSQSGTGIYNSGSSVTVTAAPNSGYTFTNWTESGTVVSTSSSYTFTISANRTLVANFTTSSQYTISTSSNPTAGGTTSGGGTFNSGSNVTVVATPNSGYTFTNWTENGTAVSTSASYTFTISSSRTLVANFAAIQYTVATSSNPTTGGRISGGGTFNSGSSVTVIATPNSGYTFTNWTENGTAVSTSASYTFSISGSRTLVANFAAIQYTVATSSSPTEDGTTSGGGTFNSGSSVTVTATPNSGYTFTNWTESGTAVSTSTSYTFTISANRTLVANFSVADGIEYSGSGIPTKYELTQNYPNPFNPSTIISYQLPASGHVLLKVFDLIGREVATLVDEFQNAGFHNSQFSTLPTGRQVLNSQLPSGIYFYNIRSGDFVQTKKMILLK